MGIELLNPFGLDAASGQLVDVGGVKRGKACGCICPSCQTPLIARHGGKKEWHFAHRSQKVHSETRRDCEYSFALSVRLMIRQLSDHGLKFRTPRLEPLLPAVGKHSCASKNIGYLVTDESLLELEKVQVGVQFCGVTVDVLGLVKNVPFVVYVTYKERSLPSELRSPSTTMCGVVELNVDSVQNLFRKEQKGQYKEALRRYIEEHTDGKTWVYHPREKKLREAAIDKLQSWSQQQKGVAMENVNVTPSRVLGEPMMSHPAIEVDEPLELGVRKYICVICKNSWEGASTICAKCKTHLYTTERE